MSLSNHYICDKEFVEYIFSLKNNVPSDLQNNASTFMFINSHIIPFSNIIFDDHESNLKGVKVIELRLVIVLFYHYLLD